MQASEDPIAEVPTVLAASGAFPQVGHHVHAPPLDLRGLRVLVPVDHVLVDRQRHQRQHLGFLPGLAERGQVLPRVAVQHQLIGNDLVRVPGQGSLLREPVLGHRPGQVPVSEHTAVELVADGVTVVQWHGHHLPFWSRWACSVRWPRLPAAL